jgi:hypothetical protein
MTWVRVLQTLPNCTRCLIERSYWVFFAAYLQWGTAQVTGGVSVTTLYPGTQFPASSELGVFWGINPAARIPANIVSHTLPI